jgi:hypothetical protein
LGPLVDPLHPVGTARARAGNRPWGSAPYATWLLVDVFHPTVTRWRGRQQLTTLAPVHAQRGIRQPSLGARSAAAAGVDAALRHKVLTELSAQLRPPLSGAAQAALAALTAVDGRLGPAVPRRRWAMGQDEPHRAATRHVALAV